MKPLILISLRSIYILGKEWKATAAGYIVHLLAHQSFPTLEILKLAWDTQYGLEGFSALLTNGTWPKLKSFKFQDLRCSDVPFYEISLDIAGKRDVFTRFLIRHPNLEEFVVPCAPPHLWSGLHFLLPVRSKLHTFGVDGNDLAIPPLSTLFAPGILSQLNKLACAIVSHCLDPLRQMENLQELIVSIDKDLLTQFLDTVPTSMIRLQINLRGRDTQTSDLRHHISQLQRLHHLTHLGGIFVGLERNPKMVEDIWKEISALLDLRLVGINTAQNIWVPLSRFKDYFLAGFFVEPKRFICDIFTGYPGYSMRLAD